MAWEPTDRNPNGEAINLCKQTYVYTMGYEFMDVYNGYVREENNKYTDKLYHRSTFYCLIIKVEKYYCIIQTVTLIL